MDVYRFCNFFHSFWPGRLYVVKATWYFFVFILWMVFLFNFWHEKPNENLSNNRILWYIGGYSSSSWWQPTTLALMITYEWWAFVLVGLMSHLKKNNWLFVSLQVIWLPQSGWISNLESSWWKKGVFWTMENVSSSPNHWFYDHTRSELRMDLVMLSFFLLLLRTNIRMLSELKLTMEVIAFFTLFFFILMW